jgi:Flp pilus assembly protein CpaB
MTRNRSLTAMLLAALIAGFFGWRFERRFGGGLDRGLLASDRRSVAVLAPDYELLDVRPGDRVDLVVVFDRNTQGKTVKYAATVLQYALVLGTARSGRLEGKGVAYLALNPMEAQFAALAPRQGEISLIVRKPGDREIHPMMTSDFRSLFR